MRLLLAVVALIFVGGSAKADPLLFFNGRLFIAARVNDLGTEALLDSAAEASLVDDGFALQAKLPSGRAQQIRGSGGIANAHLVEGSTIKALGIELHPDVLVATDLSELSTRLIKRPTNLVLGRELFDAARLHIDIEGRTIDAVARTHVPAGRALPLRKHAGVESIAVNADGVRSEAEFDLGNGSKPMVSRALAKRLNLKMIGHEQGGGIGGPLMHDLAVLRTLGVAGLVFRNVTVAIDDQPNADDLNIGTSLLKNFLITTDFSQGTVWLQPRGR